MISGQECDVTDALYHLRRGVTQGCQVGFFEANFLESGFFPRQLASENVGWLFIEIWLFPGFFVLLNVSIALPCIIELEKSSILQYMEHTIDMELCNV